MDTPENYNVGVGATKHVGSDSYAFYISESFHLKNGRQVLGMYEPDTHFEHDWTDGHEVVDKFDPTAKSEFYITFWRGNWYRCTSTGELTKPHRKDSYAFGYACSYRDPSF